MNFGDLKQSGEIVRQPVLVVGFQAVMLLAVIAGVIVFGGWNLLWLPVVAYPIVILCNVCRRMYWRGFDPFIWKAAQNEKKGMFVFWNVFTIILDWTMNAIPMATTAYIACHLASGSKLPPVFVWLAFSLIVYPPRMFTHRDHTFASDYFASSQFFLSLGLAVASFFAAVTPFFVTMLGFALTFVMVPAETWRQGKRMKRDYDQFLDEHKRGIERKRTWGSSWFPRKGVIFEPQYNKYMGLNTGVFFEFQKSLTILRINWCGFAFSFALLAYGIVRCVQLGKPLLILLSPVVVLLGLYYGWLVSHADRSMIKKGGGLDVLRGMFTFLAFIALGVPILYFGGHDLQPLVAVAALFTGMYFSFIGFMVRGTSEGVFDTLEFVLVVLGLAAVLSARLFLNVAWYDSMIAAIPFAVLLPYLRASKPRSDLPEIQEDDDLRREKKSAEQIAAKKDRRDRKRERQMAAFRRSKRG